MNLIPEIELQHPDAIRKLQWEKVCSLLTFVESNSPFYKRLLSTHGLRAKTITDWDSFEEIPTTSKDDLQISNWDFLCVPRNKIVEYTSTSGTLGKPVTIALTENDLERLAYNECISFACANGSSNDVYQLMLTLDRQFMAGIAYYEGIRKLGAGLIRVGPGLPALQWETIQRLAPTALVAVPSFAVKLIEYAVENNLDLNSSNVKKIICIGESLRTPELLPNALATKILAHWNVQLFGTYASTEMQTAFTECAEAKGGHLHPELIYVEIIGEDNKAVNPGEVGEVTITTLGVEGMPLLRYRTGDLATSYSEPCGCGRKSLRLGPIVGRKQQMIKLKGTTLYPPAIFNLLQQIDFVQEYVVEVGSGAFATDELKVHVSINGMENTLALKELTTQFQSRLRVVPEFVFASTKELDTLLHSGGGRKVSRFIDRRIK